MYISSLISRPLLFSPSICIHNNTQEQKTSDCFSLVFRSHISFSISSFLCVPFQFSGCHQPTPLILCDNNPPGSILAMVCLELHRFRFKVHTCIVYVLPNCMHLAIVATLRIAIETLLWHTVVCHIYVGIGLEKMAATLRVHEWHAQNVCVRLFKGLHEPC